MSADANDGSVTTYTYALGNVTGGAVTWTVYGADPLLLAIYSGHHDADRASLKELLG